MLVLTNKTCTRLVGFKRLKGVDLVLEHFLYKRALSTPVTQVFMQTGK
jgi:hypothetical protein